MPDQLLCCDIRVSPIIDEDKESVICLLQNISKSSTARAAGPLLASRTDPGPGVKFGVKSPIYICTHTCVCMCMWAMYDRAQSMHTCMHKSMLVSLQRVFPVKFKAGSS